MTLMSRIAVQAYRTFARGARGSEPPFQQNLSKLRDLVRHLTPADLNFDESLVCDRSPYDPDSGLAPVTFIDIWQDEHFSMNVIVLKPGTRLPLHDHPGMHGVIRMIHGRMNVCSYSLLERRSEAGYQRPPNSRHREDRVMKNGDVFTAERLSLPAGDSVDCDSEPLVLTPTCGNLHEIRSTDGPAAFFDILAPPYDDHRSGIHQCHYFQEVQVTGTVADHTEGACDRELCHLECIPPPLDYWTDHAPYEGPEFDPYDNTVSV